jgi:hypothetical protein
MWKKAGFSRKTANTTSFISQGSDAEKKAHPALPARSSWCLRISVALFIALCMCFTIKMFPASHFIRLTGKTFLKLLPILNRIRSNLPV